MILIYCVNISYFLFYHFTQIHEFFYMNVLDKREHIVFLFVAARVYTVYTVYIYVLKGNKINTMRNNHKAYCEKKSWGGKK